MVLRCGVLGEVALSDGSRTVTFRSTRTAEVLAALLVEPGHPRSVDDLVHVVWGADPPRSAPTMVHAAVQRLRDAAFPGRGHDGGALVLSRGGRYVLDPDVVVDADEFEHLVEQARPCVTSSPARAAHLLGEALALWRGPAYAGIELPYVRDEATRLDELRLRATELLADAELGRDDPERAVRVLEPHVAAHPTREHAAERLAEALARSCRTGDALKVLRRARAALAGTLGVDPGRGLQDLESALRRGVVPRGPRRRPERPPAPIDTFVGRVDDLSRLAALSEAHRLVTVTGPGGTGKTRLAIEATRRVGLRAVFVDLTRASGAERFDDTVADALGIRLSGAHLAGAVADALAGERTLVVLDNAEHVLDACADLARGLLGRDPDLRVLATSRERLGVPGELVYLLDPLPLADAVRLFLDRAATVSGSRFDATEVAGLCTALDGLPLAVELAAARTSSLSVDALAAGLGDRFRLLSPSHRHATASRRDGLAATLAWSRDLLDEDEHRLFGRLGVFPASFDAAAVGAVAGADASTLGRLVETSLVQVVDRSASRWRYRLLESTREFARTGLPAGERAALRHRHAHHYLGVVRAVGPALQRAGAGPHLDALHADRDNLRAALTWACDHEGDTAVLVGLVGVLWHYWDVRGSRDEGLRWSTAALGAVGPDHPDRPALLSGCALLHLGRGEFDDTERVAAEQYRVARERGQPGWEGDAQALRATADWARGRFDRAQHRYEDAVAASLAGGDVWRAAMEEAQLARLHRDRGQPDAARVLALRAAGHADDVGEDLARGLAADVLASIELRWGDRARADRLAGTALAHYRLVGYREGEASAAMLHGRIARAIGDVDRARESFELALAIHRRIGHRSGVNAALQDLEELTGG
ncbi:ATP-binding protein [Actinomycetospora termitidis]|uniref:BTAD domain-containing putative transcriptional regulator n=1 Tax=Actinomycetospora termitidis TaxID=3053470 RepID=A0ABT7MCB8_9PSEU|nr:BTAD domain-containing putative transcriptional regulator [Actinomycetospora sp. Odt1-22]MDL5158305.1 BTAD domain-containing putative transcriptional regulator [Actinomycetospora sp. Odt1-22]